MSALTQQTTARSFVWCSRLQPKNAVKSWCKQVSKEGEGAKVSIRNIRRDAVDKFKAQKKANELSEDDLKDAEKDVQELTDKYTKLIEKAVKEKEQEVMSL